MLLCDRAPIALLPAPLTYRPRLRTTAWGWGTWGASRRPCLLLAARTRSRTWARRPCRSRARPRPHRSSRRAAQTRSAASSKRTARFVGGRTPVMRFECRDVAWWSRDANSPLRPLLSGRRGWWELDCRSGLQVRLPRATCPTVLLSSRCLRYRSTGVNRFLNKTLA